MYKDFHSNGVLNIVETKRLKAKISSIKEKLMEGVTIRARIKQQIEGEQASSSLLSKQSVNKAKPKICQIKTEYPISSNPNIILNNQKSITEYVTNYYSYVYDNINTDKCKQEWFLNFVDTCVSDCDNVMLTAQISDDEIYHILKSFETNKSPGIDGLPAEFYIRFFHIIKEQFCNMIRNSFEIGKLTLSQRKAILILLFKGGDNQLLSSYRPISLICVDSKVI